MGVAVESAGGLSQEAGQVRQYLRMVAPLSAVFAPVLAEVESIVASEPVGELQLRGIRKPVPTHNVIRLRG